MTTRRIVIVVTAFVAALGLLYPATPGGSRVLGAEDLLYLRPPLTEVMPPGLQRPTNALLADAVEVFRPDLRWARSQLRDGELPLWNSRVFTGFPVLASQQTAILWPLNVGVFFLPFEDGAALAVLLAIMLSALGTFALARRALGLGTAAAGLAAVAYACGTYPISWLEHPHHNAWTVMPWALLAVARAIDNRRARDAGLVALAFAALTLAGHPQSALMAGTLAVAFGVYRLAGGERPAAAAWRVAGGAALGIAAGAVVLAPFLELVTQSASVSRGGDRLPLSGLLSLALPELWGRPDWAFEGAGPVNFFERTIYIGVAPLALAAVAVTARRRLRGTWFFAGAGLGCLLLAFSTPVGWAIGQFPPYSLVSMSRMLGPASLCLALVAGFGLELLLRDRAAIGRRALAAGALVLVAPLAWLVVHPDMLRALPHALGDFSPFGEASEQSQAGAAAALRWGLIALAVVALLALARRRPRLAAGALVVLAAVDVIGVGRDTHPAIDRSLLAFPQTPGVQLALANEGSDRVISDGEFLIPNVDSTVGLRDARGHGLPVLRRVQSLYAAYGGYGFQATRFYADAPGADRLADAFGARLLLTGFRDADPPIPGLEKLLEGPDERVYSNPSALSRAYVAFGWRQADSEERARALTVASQTQQLRTEPVLEGAGAAPAAPGQGSVEWLRDDDMQITLRATADRPGQLILLDTFYPGWKATVNGESVPIHAANGAFRAVAVPAGTSTVEFRYRPTSVLVGAIISVLAVLAIIALLVGRFPRAGRAR